MLRLTRGDDLAEIDADERPDGLQTRLVLHDVGQSLPVALDRLDLERAVQLEDDRARVVERA